MTQIVAVGDKDATGTLTVTNLTSLPQSLQNVDLTEITLIASCGAPVLDKYCLGPSGADRGVITTLDTATGSGGACTGRTFAVTVVDLVTGKLLFTPSSTVSLSSAGPAATCTISFKYTVEKNPTKDSGPGISGLQTDVVGYASGTAQTDSTSNDDFGAQRVTVAKDTPELMMRASPTTTVGGQLSVAATLGGTRPNGMMTFKLYGPGDPGCLGTPASTSSTSVNGAAIYYSPNVAAATIGTYRWTASYDGDDENSFVASRCNEPAAATLVNSEAITPPPPPPPPPTPGGGTTPGGATTNPGTGTGTATGTGTGSRTGTTPGALKRVRLDAFALTRRTFARATTSTALAATTAAYVPKKKTTKKAARKGTTIKYRLSAPATVTIIVERVTKGRRAGGYANTCVKATAKLKKAKRKVCTRYTKIATLKRVHKSAGAKKVNFSGRIGRKVCVAGSYRLRATASAGAGTTSAERKTTFKIVVR